MLRRWWMMAWVVVTCSACGPAQFELELSGYDDSCTTNAECALVNTLACTNVCDERAAAISKAEEGRFVRERAGLTGQCAPAIAPDCTGQTYPEGVGAYVAICQASQCELRPREVVPLSPVETQCDTSADCVVVNNTDPCDPCQCSFVGVRRDQESAFRAARQTLEATADCGAGGGECALPGCQDITYRASCVQGLCQAEYMP